MTHQGAYKSPIDVGAYMSYKICYVKLIVLAVWTNQQLCAGNSVEPRLLLPSLVLIFSRQWFGFCAAEPVFLVTYVT